MRQKKKVWLPEEMEGLENQILSMGRPSKIQFSNRNEKGRIQIWFDGWIK